MKPSREQLEAIFEAAAALQTDAQRQEYLDRACPDSDLRKEVESLLAAMKHPESLFDTQDETATEKLDSLPVLEQPGTMIGRYKLLQKVGVGGMGVVYMAEQTEPVKRKVALKIIKLGMDTKQVVARFEAERQALAMMDHPNIAKVLDAGATDTGRPYFVMELVRGVPITEYCDKNKLSTKERLELFLPVCQAIQHAHQKGVIHRDIKPSNVMVTLNEGIAHPMVIDFGIAKATNQNLTEKTLFTNYAQMLGTPAYMAPEQAEMSKLDVDTRTDVYSLGVVLYELLTGTTPFPVKELMSKGYGEMQRIITEQEPSKPSTRLSTMLNEERSMVAKNRSMEVSAVGRAFQGDLDWIVMKALEKDRTHRYDTVNGFASDIRRHLNDELVTAAAPTFGYQLKKFARRNQKYARAAAVVSSLMIVALLFSIFQTIRTRQALQKLHQEKMRAERETVRGDDIARFMIEYLQQSIPEAYRKADQTSALALMDRAENLASSALSRSPSSEFALRYEMLLIYRYLVIEFPPAIRNARRMVELLPEIPDEALPVPRQEMRVVLEGAFIMSKDESARLQSVKRLESFIEESRQDPELSGMAEVKGLNVLASMYWARGDLETAAKLFDEAATKLDLQKPTWLERCQKSQS